MLIDIQGIIWVIYWSVNSLNANLWLNSDRHR